jgi:hypothetical protein
MNATATKTSLQFNIPGVDIWAVYFDAIMSLTHAGDVDITEHPLEDGSNIADGARPKQTTIQLEAVVSDQPFIPPSFGEAQPGEGRARYIYASLSKLKDASGVIRLTTDLAVYENMLIKQLSAPQAVNLGRAVKFTMSLTQVKLVRTQTVALKAVKTSKGQPKLKDGAKSATPTPPAVANKTLLQKIGGITTSPLFGGH